MGRLYIETENRKLKLKTLADCVYKVAGQTDDLKAEVVFLPPEEVQRLNRETRGVDKTTDVLSFPTLDGVRGKILLKKDYPAELDGRFLFIGSIALNMEKVREQAIEYGNTEEEERDYLIIHGLFHLLGYDHMTEEDKKEMRAKEKAVLALLGREE